MAIDGPARLVVTVLWCSTGVLALSVSLRLYTRFWIIRRASVDDYLYTTAFCLYASFACFIHVAATYGYGKTRSEIGSADQITHVRMYDLIAQLAGVTAAVLAKLSLGCFLLRLVVTFHQRIIIIVPAAVLVALVTISEIAIWFSCTPIAYLWDQRIPGGRCDGSIVPPSALTAGVWLVIIDIWYAVFPWWIVWRLQMPQRDKMIVATSMSLGILSAMCGVMRVREMPKLASPDQLKDTIHLQMWNGIEIAICMVCTAIPVCVPLYRTVWRHYQSKAYGMLATPDRAAAAASAENARTTEGVTPPSKPTLGLSRTGNADIPPVRAEHGIKLEYIGGVSTRSITA